MWSFTRAPYRIPEAEYYQNEVGKTLEHHVTDERTRRVARRNKSLLATQGNNEATGEPKNFIALENALEAFDQGFDPMVYGTIEYQRNTKWGKLIPRINYSHRFETHGVQWELDAYPIHMPT